jgi:MFS family permease
VKVYAALARTPGVLGVFASQVFARVPIGMLSLAVLLHVQAETGSYAIAGAVVAFVSIGEAVAMPMTARLVGRAGRTATLSIAGALNAAALVLLALTGDSPALAMLLGAVIGASVPPLMPVVRALYPRMVSGDAVRALFALDTTAQEVCWVVGPLAATVLASTVSTAAPLAAAAAITVVGTAWFLVSVRHLESPAHQSDSRFGRVLRNRSVVLAIAASASLVASFMALEVGVVALYGGGSLLTGAAIAVASVGSLIGGVVFGHRRLGLRGLLVGLSTAAVGMALFGVVGDRALQFAALFVSGLGFAPALATLYLMVSRDVEERSSTEAFGWLNSGALVGGALGTAIAGVAADGRGAAGPIVVAVLFGLAAVISPLVARARGPLTGLIDTPVESRVAEHA